MVHLIYVLKLFMPYVIVVVIFCSVVIIYVNTIPKLSKSSDLKIFFPVISAVWYARYLTGIWLKEIKSLHHLLVKSAIIIFPKSYVIS